MVAVKNPLVGMQMDALAATFCGTLERQVIALTVQKVRLLAALEAATGEPWDDQLENLEEDNLEAMVAKSLERSLGITQLEALKMVRENRAKANSQNID